MRNASRILIGTLLCALAMAVGLVIGAVTSGNGVFLGLALVAVVLLTILLRKAGPKPTGRPSQRNIKTDGDDNIEPLDRNIR